MDERLPTLAPAPACFQTLIALATATLPALKTAMPNTIVGIGVTASIEDYRAVRMVNPYVVIATSNDGQTHRSLPLSQALKEGVVIDLPTMILYATMLEGSYEVDESILAWEPVSDHAGSDLRDLILLHGGVAIVDTIHSCTDLFPEEAEAHIFQRSAVLANITGTAHHHLQGHAHAQQVLAFAADVLYDSIDWSNDGIAS